MKNFFGAILFLCIIGSAPAQVIDNGYANFYQDSSYYVIADHVNLRENPDTASSIICQVPIGTVVRIVANSYKEYTRNGYTSYWQQAVCNNNGQLVEGYIWGGFLATTVITSSVDKDLFFMYGVSGITKGENFSTVKLQVRVSKNNTQLAKVEVPAVGGLYTYSQAESMGPKGVNGLVDVFKINFSDGYCGGAFGDAYFFWDGQKLHYINTLYEGFDAPYYATNTFIFPTDKNGQSGLIINKSESGYYGDDDKNHIESSKKITYKWDGTALQVVKKK